MTETTRHDTPLRKTHPSACLQMDARRRSRRGQIHRTGEITASKPHRAADRQVRQVDVTDDLPILELVPIGLASPVNRLAAAQEAIAKHIGESLAALDLTLTRVSRR
jgi:hypothetical protein